MRTGALTVLGTSRAHTEAARGQQRTMLETREITKSFGGTRALDGVSFSLRRGEVHALVGENGAGKSTLVKIISGALRPDSGSIRLDGRPIRVENPHHALRLGISIVHQHSGLVPDLTVAENIFLGRIPKTRWGLVDWKRLYRNSVALLERLEFSLDVQRRAGDLDAASQQVTEIARALSVSARVLIMDEPSAVLGSSELARLFAIVRKLKEEGAAVIYVSHRLREIFEISDRATVLKDGRIVGTYPLAADLDPSFLIKKMVGREWNERTPTIAGSTDDELLRVEGLGKKGCFRNVSFTLRAGEILGVAGLVGAGRTELCKAIFGAISFDSGQILVRGKVVGIRSPKEALAEGIAYLSKDRHNEGLILSQSIGSNITLPIIDRFTSRGVLRRRQENRFVDRMIESLQIRSKGRRQLAAALSGGNQQKVALAKWLSTEARIFLLDEPTSGIDVGAKSQIHHLVSELANRGAAVLLVSSEVPEMLSLCSRIIVMAKGSVTGHLQSAAASEESVLRLAT